VSPRHQWHRYCQSWCLSAEPTAFYVTVAMLVRTIHPGRGKCGPVRLLPGGRRIGLFDLRRAPSVSSLTIGGCAACSATVPAVGNSPGFGTEFEVQLLNAAHMRNVPGRKTDVSDAAWIRSWWSSDLTSR
jgi:hypothetical protein